LGELCYCHRAEQQRDEPRRAAAATHYVKNGKFSEGILNRIEAVVRTFDLCLSCSTHAAGQMPLALTLVSADGEVVDQVVR
jgi:NAD-reducing hydrogenase large subunit